MKKYILLLIFGIAFITVDAQKISKITGDKPGDPSLKQELANRPKLSDGIALDSLVYTKTEVNSILTLKLNSVDVENPIMLDMKKLGIPVVGVPIGSNTLFGSNGIMSGGRANGTLIYFNKTTTITGFKWIQRVIGDYTASSNNRIAIYSVHPTTGEITLVSGGATVNDGNLWKGASNSTQTKALEAPITISAGLYAIVSLYNSSSQVSAPDIYLFGGAGAAGMVPFKTNFYIGSSADIPANGTTIGSQSTGGIIYGVWPY